MMYTRSIYVWCVADRPDRAVKTLRDELLSGGIFKGSYIEVYSGIEFPKHDFQFNHDTNCRIYVAILHHSGLSYNMF